MNKEGKLKRCLQFIKEAGLCPRPYIFAVKMVDSRHLLGVFFLILSCFIAPDHCLESFAKHDNKDSGAYTYETKWFKQRVRNYYDFTLTDRTLGTVKY